MKQEDDIRQAVETMRKGGVILYPTDTVWGIGCDATNAEAVKRVYERRGLAAHRQLKRGYRCQANNTYTGWCY